MSITMLGSAAVGLVWGWLMGSLGGSMLRPLRTVPVLTLATLLLAGEVLMLANWQAVLLCLGATALTLLLHLGWRRTLRDRVRRPR